ncbi:MAG: DUF4240 domain-containing protein [Corynebacterium sp.]|nr:DUF4240 domain-containing protein [Corynebacterium sp.]
MKHFWRVIENARPMPYDLDRQVENLGKELSTWTVSEVLQFELALRRELQALDNSAVAELYLLIFNEIRGEYPNYTFSGFLSDDNYIYFRAWIILQGEAFVASVQRDINAIRSLPIDVLLTVWGDSSGESLLYVADEASGGQARERAYEEHPELSYDGPGNELQLRDEATLCSVYTELCQYLQRHNTWF